MLILVTVWRASTRSKSTNFELHASPLDRATRSRLDARIAAFSQNRRARTRADICARTQGQESSHRDCPSSTRPTSCERLRGCVVQQERPEERDERRQKPAVLSQRGSFEHGRSRAHKTDHEGSSRDAVQEAHSACLWLCHATHPKHSRSTRRIQTCFPHARHTTALYILCAENSKPLCRLCLRSTKNMPQGLQDLAVTPCVSVHKKHASRTRARARDCHVSISSLRSRPPLRAVRACACAWTPRRSTRSLHRSH